MHDNISFYLVDFLENKNITSNNSSEEDMDDWTISWLY